nr:hypothetical protein [Tanacetum cinerariifolium]
GGLWDLIDQKTRAILGFARKRSPEKFSGGDGGGGGSRRLLVVVGREY